MSKAKKCINCGCALTEENAQQYISELREQMLCDECQTRVLRFLYIVEQVGGSAMNFYYKHRRELRQEGMSADTLMYIRGVCKKLDDDRARKKEEEAERKRRQAEERPVLKSRKTVKKVPSEDATADDTELPAFMEDGAPVSDPAAAVDSAFFVDETFAENDDIPLGQSFEDAEEDAFFRLPRFYTPPMSLEQQEAERRKNNRTAGIILAAAAGTLLCIAAIVVTIVLMVRGGGEDTLPPPNENASVEDSIG